MSANRIRPLTQSYNSLCLEDILCEPCEEKTVTNTRPFVPSLPIKRNSFFDNKTDTPNLSTESVGAKRSRSLGSLSTFRFSKFNKNKKKDLETHSVAFHKEPLPSIVPRLNTLDATSLKSSRIISEELKIGIKAEPVDTWMAELPQELKRMPLHHLLIPGSHDSFSYSLEWGEVAPDSPAIVSHLASCSPCIAWPALLRWSTTQRGTVTEQLVNGIRYFDIRVAVKDGRFYFVHGLFGGDLEALLAEVLAFLETRPSEVVLLDFQHFYNLDEKLHSDLAMLLTNIFENLLCPFQESVDQVTLSILASLRQQVLIFYRQQITQKEIKFWPSYKLSNPWPQTTQVSSMIEFIDDAIANRTDTAFFVSQCVLTPTSAYLARNITGSLELNLAEPCNEQVLKWVTSKTVGSKGPNVVMTDFVDYMDYAIPRSLIKQNKLYGE